MTLTTSRWGLDRAELLTTMAAFAISSGLFVARGHPYLARGVVGDLAGLALLALVAVRTGRRLRHEALTCLAGIGVVLAADPDWPVRVSGIVWWAAVTAAVGGYVAVRRRSMTSG